MQFKIVFALICFVTLSNDTIRAQNKFLSMDDVVLSSRKGLVPEKAEQLQWIGNTNEFSFIKNGVLFIDNPSGKTASAYLSIGRLNSSLKTAGFDTVTSFPAISWKNKKMFCFNHSGKTLEYTYPEHSIKLLLDSPPQGAQNIHMNAGHTAYVYTVSNNLWLMKPDGAKQLTFDTDTNIVNGFIVHREEFGIHKGAFWSPNNNLVAFYRMDQTMVTDYPVFELDDQPARVRTVKYPMAGGLSHQVTIGIYDLRSGKTTFLETGTPADQYLTNIAWSNDENKIYVAILNRGQDHLKMNRYDAATGKFESTLFEEREEKYVHPLNPIVFDKKGTSFIWQSRRDGFNHLYQYDVSGNLIKQLTEGNWEVIDFYGYDDSGKNVFFSSNRESPINRDIYTCEINSGRIARISSGDGVHKANISKTGDYFIDEFTGPGVPSRQSIIGNSGKHVKTILLSNDPLAGFSPVTREVITIKNEAGDELYCRMVKPFPFDSSRKYPVVVYVYGGPGVQLITNTWTGGADLWSQYMAQRGVIVFTLENRGTPNRGKDFEQSTFRKLGEIEMQDQITGVKYLMSKSYVDASRLGVFGWSYGGFMSISLMTRHPGVFKVAVAGGPVIDWSYYEVMYTERYMDTPAENPEGYSKSNLLNYVQDLKGKMLLIHGTSDDVVVWQHSLIYLKKAVQKGIYPDYFVYPGHEHNVRGRDRIHLLNRVSNYFFEYLK